MRRRIELLVSEAVLAQIARVLKGILCKVLFYEKSKGVVYSTRSRGRFLILEGTFSRGIFSQT